MAWLRLDDKFSHHPKVVGLSDRAFRVHVEAMLYCAEYGTRGALPPASLRIVGASEKTVEELVTAGLWDRKKSELCVHDFERYNPKDLAHAERQARYRERHSERHENVTEASRAPSRNASRSRHGDGSSRAGQRARSRPVPEALAEGRDLTTPPAAPLDAPPAADVSGDAEYREAAAWLRDGGFADEDWELVCTERFEVTDNGDLDALRVLQDQLVQEAMAS